MRTLRRRRSPSMRVRACVQQTASPQTQHTNTHIIVHTRTRSSGEQDLRPPGVQRMRARRSVDSVSPSVATVTDVPIAYRNVTRAQHTSR